MACVICTFKSTLQKTHRDTALKQTNSRKTTKSNKHSGSSFDDFLIEDGMYEAVQARALKRALAEQLRDAMQTGNISKVAMAQRMVTSRSQLDRVLDPNNLSIQLDTLIKAARAVGKTVEIRLK